MTKNDTSLFLTIAAIGCCCPLIAEATGLSNAVYAGGDNGVSVAAGDKSMSFDLNAGTTNLQWDKLNVAADEALNFNFMAQNSTAFNQVSSLKGASVIAGRIAATGAGAASSNVVINNAAGVSFVNGSVVNVGAMTVKSDKAVKVNGLRVEKGDIDLVSNKVSSGTTNDGTGRTLTTKDSAIIVNGIVFDEAGDLTVDATKGDVTVSNVKNANKISLSSHGRTIWVSNDAATMVGDEVVDGVTAEYLQVSINGQVRVNGKVTVGKDFLVLTNGYFDENGTSEVVTRNGTFKYKKVSGGSQLSIWGADIVTTDGEMKVIADKAYITDGARVDDISITASNSENAMTIKVGSIVGDVTYNGTGGVNIVNADPDYGRVIEGQTTSVTGNLVINGAKNLTIADVVIDNEAAIKATNVYMDNVDMVFADNSSVGGYLRLNNSSLTAKGLSVTNTLEVNFSTVNLTNATIGHYLLLTDASYTLNNVRVLRDIYVTKADPENPIYSEELQPLVDSLAGTESKLYAGYTARFNSSDKLKAGWALAPNLSFSGDIETYGVDANGREIITSETARVHDADPIRRREEEIVPPVENGEDIGDMPADDIGNTAADDNIGDVLANDGVKDAVANNAGDDVVTADASVSVETENTVTVTHTNTVNGVDDFADNVTINVPENNGDLALDANAVTVAEVAEPASVMVDDVAQTIALEETSDEVPVNDADNTLGLSLRNGMSLDDDSRRHAALRTIINNMMNNNS